MHPNSDKSKAKILIVEDESLITTDLASRLKTMGYTVCANVTSAEKALELVDHELPDLVLIDIVIRGEMDRIKAAQIIRLNTTEEHTLIKNTILIPIYYKIGCSVLFI